MPVRGARVRAAAPQPPALGEAVTNPQQLWDEATDVDAVAARDTLPAPPPTEPNNEPPATVISPCPSCGEEGEADIEATSLVCPFCEYST